VYDQKAVRRRRAVLGLLVACSLILLTAYFGEPATGGLHSVQRGFLEVVSPIQEGASRALKPVRDLFGWFGDTIHAKSQRDELRKEVEHWRAQAIASQAKASEADQLAGILKLDRQLSLDQMSPMTARVTGRSPTLWYSTITIDRGTADGVHADQPVITQDGLIGTVETAARTSSLVRLITDQLSGVSAAVASTGVTGIVQAAAGDPNDLRLEFIRHGDSIRVGQNVITAGTTDSQFPSPFPRGIPIGRVTQVDPNELDLYQRVHIKPFAQLRQVGFVQVLRRPTRRPLT
jgi:rod shape-determining protein MreC